MAACRAHSARLGKLRARFRILSLLGVYLTNEPRAVRRFWFAFRVGTLGHGLAVAGRYHVGAHLFSVYFTGTFHDCQLPVKAARDPNSFVVHPACLCATTPNSQRVGIAPAAEPWIQPVIRPATIEAGGWPSHVVLRARPSAADGRDSASVADAWPRSVGAPPFPTGSGASLPSPASADVGGLPRRRRLKAGARFCVPWYVKNTKLLRPECRETLSLFAPADAPLRFQRMPTAHLEFSLRQKACRILEMQPVLFKAVDEGIANAAQFFDALAQEVEDYCVGDVGTDVDMQAIQSDAILCFFFRGHVGASGAAAEREGRGLAFVPRVPTTVVVQAVPRA